jgi:hypothetical protein
MVFQLSNNFCQCSKECTEKATDAHHLLPNTKVNRIRFPLFINSIFNFMAANNGCHLTKPMPKITEHQAEIYEEWLRLFKKGKL